MKVLVKFVHKIHAKGIKHLDLSLENILFKEVNGKFLFMLVDLNRMRFGELSLKDRFQNFKRLRLTNIEMATMVDTHATLY